MLRRFSIQQSYPRRTANDHQHERGIREWLDGMPGVSARLDLPVRFEQFFAAEPARVEQSFDVLDWGSLAFVEPILVVSKQPADVFTFNASRQKLDAV